MASQAEPRVLKPGSVYYVCLDTDDGASHTIGDDPVKRLVEASEARESYFASRKRENQRVMAEIECTHGWTQKSMVYKNSESVSGRCVRAWHT